MKKRKNTNKNLAVAGVIEALLLVGLVAIVISIIQLQYIPTIMEQREADHMDQVSNQFSTLKSFIEMQSITKATAPFSTMLTLSSEPLPYFITAGSTGTVSVDQLPGSYIDIDNGAYQYDLTSIKYEASNVYFVEQSYILEGGGIIVKQPDGNAVMRVDPSIRIENGSTIKIFFDLPIFIGVAGKDITSGVGKCFIRTNWSEGDLEIFEGIGINFLNISTQYPTAWYESLHTMLENNVNFETGESYVRLSKKDGRPIFLYLKYYYIYVQIGIGWIK
ncbi:MAG: hypothetical protein R6V50_02730 [Thermoplasmatota archaeon]